MLNTLTKIGQENSFEVTQEVLEENIIIVFFVNGK